MRVSKRGGADFTFLAIIVMSGAKPPPPPTESPRPPSLPMTQMRRRRRIKETRRFSEGRNGADETRQLPRPWPLFIPHSLRRGRRRRTFWQGALSPSLSSESKRVSQSPQEIYDRNPPPPPSHTRAKSTLLPRRLSSSCDKIAPYLADRCHAGSLQRCKLVDQSAFVGVM